MPESAASVTAIKEHDTRPQFSRVISLFIIIIIADYSPIYAAARPSPSGKQGASLLVLHDRRAPPRRLLGT